MPVPTWRPCLPLLLAGVACCADPAWAAGPDPGVSEDLARARRQAISSVRYGLEFHVPVGRTSPVRGRVAIDVALVTAREPLVLDFAGVPSALLSVRIQGATVPATVTNGHVVIPRERLRAGENHLEIEFEASDGPLNRGDDFLYTLFVPARAHRAFPCFDQPDLRARVALTLHVPADWKAVANGPERSRRKSGGGLRIDFAETRPIPTYLIAFAAGRIDVETAIRGGRTFRMFHRETDAAKLVRNRNAIFDLHAAALAWLEAYTGVPYPWAKFDFFIVPAFQFSGMEHPGAIYYNAPALLLEESATQQQLLGRASLIAHETAHMWFGDLVTMRWFDDVWMKEVFANFFAAKIVDPSFPQVNHALRFLLAHYPTAYDVDRTAGTHPIRQPLANLEDAGSLYGPIIYQKAPIVMRQLERLAGEGGLRDGLREYLARYAFGNASWPDLVELLDRRVEPDLVAWSRAWVAEPGRPTIRSEVTLDPAGRVAGLALLQEDPHGRELVWPQSLEVAIASPAGTRVVSLTFDRPRVEMPDAIGGPAPSFVLPNAGGLGYGLFLLDPASLDRLVSALPAMPDALTRGSARLALWDNLLEGRFAPGRWLDVAMDSLAFETDELNVQRILAETQTVFWRFLPTAERDARAPGLEALYRDGMDRAASTTLKAAWFQALARIALTTDTLAWLERVWRKQARVPGLVLSETDDTTLALELAVREVPAWREVLTEQLARIVNPDRKARFAFVLPALDADPEVRDALFTRLGDVAQRRREPWVLEALAYLHHPLRAERSERYVGPSLEMLEEIRRTGDIFFPKRWMDATLGGHRSASVAATVRRFMETRPEYPPRLRRIVLQSADELFRAVRLATPSSSPSSTR